MRSFSTKSQELHKTQTAGKIQNVDPPLSSITYTYKRISIQKSGGFSQGSAKDLLCAPMAMVHKPCKMLVQAGQKSQLLEALARVLQGLLSWLFQGVPRSFQVL